MCGYFQIHLCTWLVAAVGVAASGSSWVGSGGRGWWRYAYKCSACLHWSQAQVHTKAALCWVLGVVQVLVPSTGARGKTHKGWDWVQTTRQWTARAASSYHHQLDCYHHLLFFYLLFIPLSYWSSRKTMFCSPLPHYTLHAHPDICTRLSAGCRACRSRLWRVSSSDTEYL